MEKLAKMMGNKKGRTNSYFSHDTIGHYKKGTDSDDKHGI